MSARAKWLLFVAIVLFPFALSVTTYEIGSMRTRRVDFCASCHVMTPFTDGVRDPNESTLAALHFQNRWIPKEQCYTCHVDYGLFGEIDAKIRSVRHAAVFYLKKEIAPPKLYKPFPNRNCLNCHEGSRKFEANEVHAELKKETGKIEASCLECHGPAHPGGEAESWAGK